MITIGEQDPLAEIRRGERETQSVKQSKALVQAEELQSRDQDALIHKICGN